LLNKHHKKPYVKTQGLLLYVRNGRNLTICFNITHDRMIAIRFLIVTDHSAQSYQIKRVGDKVFYNSTLFAFIEGMMKIGQIVINPIMEYPKISG
jgi:hypothetical protein